MGVTIGGSSKERGKWRVCIDYRELNKATRKDHFPVPLIEKGLDALAGKKYFDFLDGFSGYNQIQIHRDSLFKCEFPSSPSYLLYLLILLSYLLPAFSLG